MKNTVFIIAIIVVAGFALNAEAAVIQIDNLKNESVKVCVYRPSNKTFPKPLQCWTIKKRKRVYWRRGADTSRFDLRVFRPALIDRRICEDSLPEKVVSVFINPTAPCISYEREAPDAVAVKDWKKGESVLVNKSGDDYWYPGTIETTFSVDYRRVRFARGSLATVNSKYISGDYITSGTRVFGNRKKRGRYYPGRIVSRNGNRVSINYDDGAKENTTLGYIRLAFVHLPKPPKRYKMRVCNRSVDERVYFSIAFPVSKTNYVSEGWWYVNPKGCFDIDLSKRWKMHGVSEYLRPKTYIYGETKGIFGGAIKKAWEGTDARYAFCVNEDKGAYFKNMRYKTVNGIRRKSACDGAREMVRMSEVRVPSSGTVLTWNF